MGGSGDYPRYDTNYTALNYSETLRLVYDPAKLNYSTIMETYWKFAPDATMPEEDPAYMLRIFVDDAQRPIAEASLKAQQARLNTTIYANIYDAKDFVFWKAGEEHQQYDYKAGMRCGQIPKTRGTPTPRGTPTHQLAYP